MTGTQFLIIVATSFQSVQVLGCVDHINELVQIMGLNMLVNFAVFASTNCLKVQCANAMHETLVTFKPLDCLIKTTCNLLIILFMARFRVDEC